MTYAFRDTTLAERELFHAEHSAEIAQAEAYVTGRFYPPLPREYGALAVLALREVNDGNPHGLLDVSHLPVTPKGTNDRGQVTAETLVDALRLWHLTEAYLEEDDVEEDHPAYA